MLPAELQLQILEAADWIQFPTLTNISSSSLSGRYAAHPRAIEPDTAPPISVFHMGITYLTHLQLIKRKYHPCRIEFYDDIDHEEKRERKMIPFNWGIFLNDPCILPATLENPRSSLQTHTNPPIETSQYSTNFVLTLEDSVGGLPIFQSYDTVVKLFKSIAYFHNTVFVKRRRDESLSIPELVKVRVDCRFYPGSRMTILYIWVEEEERGVADIKETVRFVL